jgi:low affinity Fe/Cu permease
MNMVKQNKTDYLMVVIVAKNWSKRETATLEGLLDYLVVIDQLPSEFVGFDNDEQLRLNRFIATVFNGDIKPKSLEGG